MACVRVQVAGGRTQTLNADSVGELAGMCDAEGYQATVNGEPADEDTQLRRDDFVSFARPVKAGSGK